MAAAEIGDAQAVICADDDDELNLEIALLARQANPNVRVVARLGNSVLREAMAQDNGPGAILEVRARVCGRFGGLYKIEGEVTADGCLAAAGSVTLSS